MKFLAIDFETADYQPDSACAVGLVRVENNIIVKKETFLIRPPRSRIIFTPLHGITWDDVKHQPTFGELWERIHPMMHDVDFLVAHNARFDKGVLHACCHSSGITPPEIPFKCTVQLSRRLWKLKRANLPAVCRHFGIPLRHHDAASDTEACAQIMILALETMNETSH
jgi:DNA polymerase-3 subunit epsilon